MEQLNRVQLRGHIGSIKLQTIGCSKVARFSVATNYAYKDAQGYCVIETTWTNITAFDSDHITSLDNLHKGSKVEVIGRLRNQRFTRADGTDAYSTDVLASELTIIPDDSPFTFQQ